MSAELTQLLDRCEAGPRRAFREALFKHAGRGGFTAAFFNMPKNWQCLSCGRQHHEILRIASGGYLIGKIVLHHDHFGDHVVGLVESALSARWGTLAALLQEVMRHAQIFAPIYICEDCNTLDGLAKRCLGIRGRISFPSELISRFCLAKPHAVPRLATVAMREAHQTLLAMHDARLDLLVEKLDQWLARIEDKERDCLFLSLANLA